MVTFTRLDPFSRKDINRYEASGPPISASSSALTPAECLNNTYLPFGPPPLILTLVDFNIFYSVTVKRLSEFKRSIPEMFESRMAHSFVYKHLNRYINNFRYFFRFYSNLLYAMTDQLKFQVNCFRSCWKKIVIFRLR